MKIACIVETYPCLTESFIDREISELRRLGCRVAVLACGNSDGVWQGDVFDEDRRKYGFFSCLESLGITPRSFCKVGTVANAASLNGKPDIVWANFATYPGYIGRALAKIWNVPLVVSVHAEDVFVENSYSYKSLKAADVIVACSKAAKEQAAKICGSTDNVKLNRHGLPKEYFDFTTEGRGNNLLAVGRLVEKKGFKYLLHAFSVLLETRRLPEEAQLVIAGDGPLKKELQEKCKNLGIEKSVVFSGRLERESVLDLMKRAFVLCCPSVVDSVGNRDGIPNVILESMACGLPVIGTECGGIPEVVRNGDTGLLVEAGNVNELSEAIAELYDNSEIFNKIRKNAYNLVRNEFSSEKNTGDLLKIFYNLK